MYDFIDIVVGVFCFKIGIVVKVIIWFGVVFVFNRKIIVVYF